MKDTIYRDDAIKCCRNEWEEEVEERLRLLPSAERKEDWISYVEEVPWGDGTIEVTRFKCPRCLEIQDAETKFCSNCGQDLRLDRDRWISCAEYLPSDFEDVLVWYEYFRYGDYNRMYQTYGIGNYDSLYDIWGGDVNGHKARAIAWMPLPKPYSGAEDMRGEE